MLDNKLLEESKKELIQLRDESYKEVLDMRDDALRSAEVLKRDFSGMTKKKANRQAIGQILAIVIPIFIMTTMIGFYTLWTMGTSIDMNTSLRVFEISVPISLFIATIVAIIILRNRMQILEISNALEQAMMGNLDYRLNWYQKGVMGQAYIDFNRMCQQLKASRKEMNKAIDEANRANSAKSTFLSNMSHEIRTPINAVLGMDEMIIRESREQEIRDYAMDIRSAGKTLLSLINDILDFSKIESGKMEIIPVEYDLSSVINDLLNMTANKAKDKNLELEVNVNENIPHLLYGDEIRIKQVALNILNNAVKYTDAGKVTLFVDFDELEGKKISLQFRVVDTGKGIKEEDLDKLFSPFERIEEKRNRTIEGTGLGMSITKNLLSMMNSKLDVSSIYGEGSDFSFAIVQEIRSDEPIGDFEESYRKGLEAENMYQESFHAPGAHILVIDDVTMNLTVVKSLLKRTLINIDTGDSGKTCLAMASEKHYDMIFIDHMMPDMDGIETLMRLKEECPMNANTPIIVLTANAVSGAREKYMQAGFDNYITKPIDSEKLEKMICRYLPKELVDYDFVPAQREADLEQKECADACGEVDDGTLAENVRNTLAALEKLKLLDIKSGIKAVGNKDSYITVVKDFYNTAAGRIEMISNYYEALDYRNYTIQVHALKSSARIIGYNKLSAQAEYLEQMGNEENEKEIQDKTPSLISLYGEVTELLGRIFDDDSEKPLISDELLNDALCSIIEVVTAYDFDTADMIMNQLSDYSMPVDFIPTYAKLRSLIAEVERDGIIEILSKRN